MTGNIVVLNTCSSEREAETVARALIDSRVAACVNIVPGVRSLYRWKGEVEDSQEYLLIIKTRTALLDQLKSELRKVHSYEVPELIALPILDGLPEYLAWIDEETSSR